MKTALPLFVLFLCFDLYNTFYYPTKPELSSLPTYSIIDYGAKGDGRTLNTKAINLAIAQANANGGGIVLVPTGSFLSGAFQVTGKNIYLQIEGEIIASDDASDYYCLPSVTSDTGPCDYPFIALLNGTNVGILGSGSVNGGANSPPGHLVAQYLPESNYLVPKGWNLPNCSGYSCRPKLLVIRDCLQVTIHRVSLLNSPLWTVTIINSHYVSFDEVTVAGDRRWPNNDGIDPISGSFITIQNSNISTGDDGICLITHTHEDIHDVLVRNCTLASTSAALKVSSFESIATGRIYHVLFENCKISDTNRGLAVVPRWGSSRIEDIQFSNIELETRYFSELWWGNAEPIHITGMDASASNLWTGSISDIRFVNITGRSENGIIVVGQAQRSELSHITFDGLNILIDRFGNVSRPCHDWRPSRPPQIFAAPVNGVYISFSDFIDFRNSVVKFGEPHQTYYGACLNLTATAYHVDTRGFDCSQI
eukprot:TRINITY_DN6515_c0_g1_i1.p1 TRINITY_DN6515_c0_g1~~TRINITY_DN6515_c0_g1_i1.p1  ORF type:complete len:480 (-),score=72.39 TRINITY_DN6515_c0_g1_i1:76-1515(-)